MSNIINIHNIDTRIREERKKQSNFLITVNTNQIVNSFHAPLVSAFAQCVEKFINNLPDYVDTREGYPTNDIRTFEIYPRIERGKKRGLLHTHIQVEISHGSNIKLSYDRIREYFTSELGLEGIHLNVKGYRKSSNSWSNSTKILKYISKE